MAGKNVKPDDTAVILKNFAIIFPLFYIAYYAITGILSAIVGSTFDGREPFFHACNDDKCDFNPAAGGTALVTWLSFVLMLFVATSLIYYVVRSTQMAWDYAVTFSFVHFILSIIVTGCFPVNWIWWVTVVLGTFLLSSMAEMSCYYLRDMRSIKVDHE